MAELEFVGFDSTGKEIEAPQGADTYVAKKAAKFEQPVSLDSTMDGRDIATDGTKLDLITVTAPVDLDAIAAAQGPGAVILMPGGWDASTGLFPPSTLIGETWVCTVAGITGGIQFELNDRVTALVDGASTTVYIGNWIRAQYADLVTSVAGRVGAVVIEEADIGDLQAYMVPASIDSLAKLNALVLDATLGDAADFATAAQGALAATALQDADISSLASLNALVLDATLVDVSALHARQHSIMDTLDHSDVEPDTLETGSVLTYVAVADGGNDKFRPVNAFVTAGYGGISVDSADAMAALGVGWEKVAGFDTNLITTPKNVTHDLANGALELDKEGIWQTYVKVSLTFDEAVGSRTVKLRLWNLTKAAVASSTFNFFVGRDTAGVNLTFTLNNEIITADVGDKIQLEVGGGDAFTTVINIGTIFQANHISEYTP